jgi:hypothetical protein
MKSCSSRLPPEDKAEIGSLDLDYSVNCSFKNTYPNGTR